MKQKPGGRIRLYTVNQGERYGKWTVLEPETFDGRARRVLCRCECGFQARQTVAAIASGHSKGCRACTRKGTRSERAIWHGMKARCSDTTHRNYKYYGGKGIKVCTEWLDFDRFYADMGPRPSPLHSIDRINSDCDYGPGNCRWATHEEQNNNRSCNRRIEFDGQIKTVSEWAKALGIDRDTLQSRIDAGWPIEKCFSEPTHDTKRRFFKSAQPATCTYRHVL